MRHATSKSIIIGIFIAVTFLAGWLAFRSDEPMSDELAESRKKLEQARQTLNLRQEELRSVGETAALQRSVSTEQDQLFAKRDELEKVLLQHRQELNKLGESWKDAVDRVRAAGMGEKFAQLPLRDGRILRDATISAFGSSDVTFSHADGVGVIPHRELPDDFRNKYALDDGAFARELSSQTSADTTSTKANDMAGRIGSQSMDGLQVICPVPLEAAPAPTPPPGISRLQSWMGKDPSHRMSVAILVMDTLEGNTLNLDGLLNGAVASITKMGTSKASHSMQEKTVSGLPAKICSFSATAQDQPVNMEVMGIQKQRRFYMVQVIFSSSTSQSRELANTIIGSAMVD